MGELLDRTDHRPWPLPEAPWIQEHRWCSILFAHWPVPVEALRPHVPPELELDTWDGTAWLGITPFCIRDARLRGVPPVPFLSTFPEVDLRTYVRLGDRPGVYFLGMEAPNPVVAAAARLVYHLPYVGAEVSEEREGERVRIHSRRNTEGAEAEWDAVYEPVSPAFEAQPGTLEYFLIERWALYAAAGEGKLDRAEIHRLPWSLHQAEAEVRRNTLAAAYGLSLPDTPPLLHFSEGAEVRIWPPSRVLG